MIRTRQREEERSMSMHDRVSSRVYSIGATLALAVTLSACAVPPGGPAGPATAPARSAESTNTAGAGTSLRETQSNGPSRWELVRWTLADGTIRDIPHGDNGEPIVFEFNAGIDAAQGTVSGNSGCNRFSGSYGKTADGMRFDRVAGTRMACAPERMGLESNLLNAMSAPLVTVGTQPSSGSTGRQIIWKTSSGDLLQFVEREGVGRRGAKVEQQALAGVAKTVYVAPQRVPCTGVAQQTCYRVADTPDGPWSLWYGPIEGLDFEPGIAYVLRVRETRVPGPAADAASIRWQLLSVVSRKRAE
jgi:heat shock protein HslJ